MFKRPTAGTRPAECELNHEEMGKSNPLVASIQKRGKTISDLTSIILKIGEGISLSFRKRRFNGSFGSRD